MSMSVGSSTASAVPASVSDARKAQERRATIELTGALRSGDIGAAQSAYAKLTKNLPQNFVANPKTAINQLGQALDAGDLGAAKKALGEVAVHVHEYRKITAAPTPSPVGDTPPAQPTSGSVGSLLNAVA